MKYYTKDELEHIYIKVSKVILGCKTIAQLYSAHKYCRLFIKKVNPIHRSPVLKEINSIMERQKIKVRLHEHKFKKNKKA